ncbi:three-helix bundle dimerization domain-containing protein [Mycobacterium sp.]|uniref:three-helix bundle dimerization domain-containing protein n=1 Tax=Mycobacterium sp. TaxID=1785 RepID=UPI003F9C6FA7
MDEVRQRLVRKFAHLPQDHISAAVADAYARFTDSSVRDFVPLLAERRASQSLSGRAAESVTAPL